MTRPPDPESWPSSVGRGSWFKLSSFWIEAEKKVSHWQLITRRKVSPVSHTDLAVSEGHWMRHGRPGTRVEESQPEREYVVVRARGAIKINQTQLPYRSSFEVSVSLICDMPPCPSGRGGAASSVNRANKTNKTNEQCFGPSKVLDTRFRITTVQLYITVSTNQIPETMGVPVPAVTPRPCNQHFGAPFHLNSLIIRTPDYPLPIPPIRSS